MVVTSGFRVPSGVSYWKGQEALLSRHSSGAVITKDREPPAGKRPLHPWCAYTDYKIWGWFRVGKGYQHPRNSRTKALLFYWIPAIIIADQWRRQHTRRAKILNPVSNCDIDELYWAQCTAPPLDFEKDDDLREHIQSFGFDPDRMVGLLNMNYLPMGGGAADCHHLQPKAFHIPGEKAYYLCDYPVFRWFRWWRNPSAMPSGDFVWTREDLVKNSDPVSGHSVPDRKLFNNKDLKLEEKTREL